MVYIDGDEVKRYFETYIEAYGEVVKAAGKPGQEPEFYKAMPYKVDIFKMPNEAVVAMLYGRAPKPVYTIYDGEYDTVLEYIGAKAHQNCIMFYPTKNYSTDDAKADAKATVSKDTRATIYRAGLMAGRTHVEDIGKQLSEIAKANPWLEKQLKDLEAKLLKAKAPLDKLWGEYKKYDEAEVFLSHEMSMNEVKGVDKDTGIEMDPKAVETFLRNYIDTYKKAIKPEYPEHAKPPFFKGAPHKVRATIMPNMSVAVLFKYDAIVESFEVAEGDYDGVKALIDNKDYNRFIHFPPLKDLSDKRAGTEAKLAVKEDIRNSLHLALLRSTSKVIIDHQEKIKDIMKTNPWLEGPLSSISNRLSGVAQLLKVLTGEIENNQLNTKASDQKRLLMEVSRFGKPKAVETEPEPEPEPEPVPAPVPEPVYTPPVVEESAEVPVAKAKAELMGVPTSSGPLFMPSSAVAGEAFPDDDVRDQAQQYAPQEQMMVSPGMTEEEKTQMNELRAEVYGFRKKMDDFDRKINYMDKYIETQVQNRQDEKFKEQEEIYTSMIKKWSGVATGLGTAAIIIGVLALLFNLDSIISSLGSLFG